MFGDVVSGFGPVCASVSKPVTSVCLSFLSHGRDPCLTQGLPQGFSVRTEERRKTQEPLGLRLSMLAVCWTN